MFNMMIMDKKCFEHYCKWLFDILFELKTKIDMPKLSAFQEDFMEEFLKSCLMFG